MEVYIPMIRQSIILEYIDDINTASYESEMNVLTAMNDSYYKASLILENYEGEELDTFELFSESYYLESASGDKDKKDEEKPNDESFFRRTNKKTGKKENILISILFAIPRIIIKLGEMLVNLFKKDKKKQSPDAIEKAEKEANALSENFFKMIDYISPNLRADCQLMINKEIKKYGLGTKIVFYTITGANIGLDAVHAGVTIFDIKSQIIGFIKRIRKIYERFTEDLNLGNPDNVISKCAKEIKAVLDKDKDFSLTTVEYTGKMFLTLYDQMRDICKVMSDSTKVLGKTMSAVLKKCKESGNDAKTLETATDLVNKCNKINNDILYRTRIVKTVRDYTGMCMSLIGLVYPIEYLNEGLLMDTDEFIEKLNKKDKSLIKELSRKAVKELMLENNLTYDELERLNIRSSNDMISVHWHNCIQEMILWKDGHPRKSGEGDLEYCTRFYKQFIKERTMKDLINTIKSGVKGEVINKPTEADAIGIKIDNAGNVAGYYFRDKLHTDNLKVMGKKKVGKMLSSKKVIEGIEGRTREYTERLVSKDN